MNRNGSTVPFEDRLRLLAELEWRRRVRPGESLRDACRSIDPNHAEALRSMFRRRSRVEDEGLNRIARMQLNSDAAAVVNGMTDSELARLAHNIDVVLEEREIARIIEGQPFRSHQRS